MHSRFEVRGRDRELLGIFPAPLTDHADQIKTLIRQHPGAEVTPVVTLDNPCPRHDAYEADNCPRRGLTTTR